MTTIIVKPDERTTNTPPPPPSALTLAQAANQLWPGVTLKLLPGRYLQKIALQDVHGRENEPIIIEGDPELVVLDGQKDPVNGLTSEDRDWVRSIYRAKRLKYLHGDATPFFIIKDSSWIEFRDLKVRRCWPTFLYIRSCHHISVAGCKIQGGRLTVNVFDRGAANPSHHILIENNDWCQDPTGDPDPSVADEKNRQLWQDWTWHEMKKKPKTANYPDWRDLRFTNGGFLHTTDLAGSIIVRNNTLRFAFNAIRMEVAEKTEREPLKPGHQGDAPPLPPPSWVFNYAPPTPDLNTNVEIYGNTIEYIRDNAVEPEYGSRNWWIWNNKFTNVHKIFSIHNNGGGHWYFFGNAGSTEALPPAQVKEPNVKSWRKGKSARKLGGKVFKFVYGPPLPHLPSFAFHNSWRPRGGVVTGGGEIRAFRHYNNAIQHNAPADPSVDLKISNPTFAEIFDPKKHPDVLFDYEFATEIEPLGPDAENRFDNDISNGADFPEDPRRQLQEMGGVKATIDIFDPTARAAFALSQQSEARGLAKSVTLTAHIDWPAEENWNSDAPDAGALQDNGWFVGPWFAHMSNPHYQENPRIVGAETTQDGLALVCSVPLSGMASSGTNRKASVDLTDGQTIECNAVEINGRRLVLRCDSAIDPATVASVVLPNGVVGRDGSIDLPLTAWASTLPVKISQ